MAANTWPPSITRVTAEVASDAVTTVRWGTDGLVPGANEFFYVCTRFNQNELTDVIELPQGSGLPMGRVYIRDGVQWSVTVRDDTNWTVTGLSGSGSVAPVVGTYVTVADGAGMIGVVGTTYSARVVDNGYEAAVKQPGERVLVLERLTLIEAA